MRVVIAIFDDDIAFNNDNGSGVDSIDNDKGAELVATWLNYNLHDFYLQSDDNGCHLALLQSLHSGGVPLQAPPKAAGKQEPESIHHK